MTTRTWTEEPWHMHDGATDSPRDTHQVSAAHYEKTGETVRILDDNDYERACECVSGCENVPRPDGIAEAVGRLRVLADRGCQCRRDTTCPACMAWSALRALGLGKEARR